jgi:RHH-type proline utilization regulon transcriptional repressor/proline dehydrogenase/delta 1-pyrroline-5-carboxylate dehydrogenase
LQRLHAAAGSYAHAWATHFSLAHDPSQVLGESNVFRYRPIRTVLIRVEMQKQLMDACLALLAAQQCGVAASVFCAPSLAEQGGQLARALNVPLLHGDDDDVAAALSQFERLRVFGPQSDVVCAATNAAHVHIADQPALTYGRLELRHYLREQSLTQTTHRYGNLVGG